jgi:hypothetical protein
MPGSIRFGTTCLEVCGPGAHRCRRTGRSRHPDFISLGSIAHPTSGTRPLTDRLICLVIGHHPTVCRSSAALSHAPPCFGVWVGEAGRYRSIIANHQSEATNQATHTCYTANHHFR